MSLAYVTAQTNGLTDLASDILSESGHDGADLPALTSSSLSPPKTVTATPSSNWPTIAGEENFFEKAMLNGHAILEEEPHLNGIDSTGDTAALDQWAAEDAPGEEEDVEEEAWDLADDEDAFFDPEINEGDMNGELTADASRGVTETELWKRNSAFAADHIAAGSFESAMQVRLTSYYDNQRLLKPC